MRRGPYVVVFLIGILIGAVGHRLIGGRRRPRVPDPDRLVARLTSELNLTGAQQEQARVVIVDEQAKMKALHDKDAAEFEANRKEIHDRLAAILTPEQKERFEALIARSQARHAKDWPQPGRP